MLVRLEDGSEVIWVDIIYPEGQNFAFGDKEAGLYTHSIFDRTSPSLRSANDDIFKLFAGNVLTYSISVFVPDSEVDRKPTQSTKAPTRPLSGAILNSQQPPELATRLAYSLPLVRMVLDSPPPSNRRVSALTYLVHRGAGCKCGLLSSWWVVRKGGRGLTLNFKVYWGGRFDARWAGGTKLKGCGETKRPSGTVGDCRLKVIKINECG